MTTWLGCFDPEIGNNKLVSPPQIEVRKQKKMKVFIGFIDMVVVFRSGLATRSLLKFAGTGSSLELID